MNKQNYRKMDLKEVQNILKELMEKVDDFCDKNDIKYYIIGGTLLGAVRHKGFIPWDDDIDIAMTRDNYYKFLSLCDKFDKSYEIKNFNNDKYCDHVITRIYVPNTYIDNPAARKTRLDKRLYFDIFPLDVTPNTQEERCRHAEELLKLKKRLWWSIPFQNSKNALKRCARKLVSMLLAPFRKKTIKQLNEVMTRYSDSNSGKLCSMASQYKYSKQTMDESIYGEPQKYVFEGSEFCGPAKSHEYLSQLYGEDYMEVPPIEKRRKGYDVYVKET